MHGMWVGGMVLGGNQGEATSMARGLRGRRINSMVAASLMCLGGVASE